MAKLFLVRHGETHVNKTGLTHQHLDSASLNKTGTEQIKQTASILKKYQIDRIISSNEIRAIESGNIIAEILGLSLETITGIEERNWGDLSGKSWSEIQKILDTLNTDKRYHYIPPNGESWQNFESRLIKSIKGVLIKYPDQNLVIVSHGGAIRTLMPFLLDLPIEESYKYNPDNASITIFEIQSNFKFIPDLINSTSHLHRSVIDHKK